MVQKPPVSLPSQVLPLVDEDGRATEGWYGFFVNLTSAATPLVQITVGVSPFVFTASHAGFGLIIGGVVSSVGLRRRRVTIPAVGPVAGFFPVSQNDQLIITYTGLPVLWFIPNGNPS
jgi:hypothetical protein